MSSACEPATREPRQMPTTGQALLPVPPWREAREPQDRGEVDHVSMPSLRRLACNEPATAGPSGPPTTTEGLNLSRTEDIDNGIWDDSDFASLSPNATLLYLWSWTNPRCGMSGVYKVPLERMAESKVPSNAIQDALDELAAGEFLFYEAGVLWVRARVKRLRARSPQMAKSIAKDLRNIPDGHPLKARFVVMYGGECWLRGAVQRRYDDGIDTVSKTSVSKGNPDTVSIRSLDRPGTVDGVRDREGVSEEPQTEGSTLPEGFPEELKPHIRAVYRILKSLAERHRSKAVTPTALANVVMARQHKPLVKAAYDCAAYWDDRKQPLKDTIAAYRNWLDRTDDLATIEPLDEKGSPGGRVVSLTDKQARSARRAAAFDRTTNGGTA